MWVALRYSGHNLFTGSNVLNDNTSTATVTATETAADNDSVASNSNGNINAAGISRRHDRYVDSAWGLDLTPRMYLSNNFALLNLVSSYHLWVFSNTIPSITAFLYQSYRSSFVYWEILETCFRLLLIAVLPYFRQQLRPLQLVNDILCFFIDNYFMNEFCILLAIWRGIDQLGLLVGNAICSMYLITLALILPHSVPSPSGPVVV